MVKKRVWALYRVSSNKQNGTDDDIPNQKKVVHRFIESHADEWELTRELVENAVSGFKNKVEDRILADILKAAENDEFDVLVVWRNDRVGRFKTEMTRFTNRLIKRFKKELWSALEGQKKLSSHMDTLVNDIDWWRAEGESKKISESVTPILRDMYESGEYVGGRPAYGFENYFTGKLHPKNNKALTYKRICEPEAEILRLAFEWSDTRGWGTLRIAKALNQLGYTQRSGTPWRPQVLHRAMTNPIVNGRQRYNMSEAFDDDEERTRVSLPQDEWKTQPQVPEWVIIDDELFARVMAQFQRRKRNTRNTEDTTPIVTHGKLLLSGIAKCGYCGERLYANYTGKKYKKRGDNGEEVEYKSYRYECVRGKADKSGHERYLFAAKKYESAFEQILKQTISAAKLDAFTDEYIALQRKRLGQREREIQQLADRKKKVESEIDRLNDEVVRVLLGESKFTEETLTAAIAKKKADVSDLESSITLAEAELAAIKESEQSAERVRADLVDFVERYDGADLDRKKTLIASLVDFVTFRMDELDIEFNASLRGVEFEELLRKHNEDALPAV